VSGERFEQSVKRLQPLEERASALSILTVGRLIPPKYQACLIEAVARLNATLTVIGDGILRESLERLVDELQIRQQVRFIRAVPHQEIARYYAAADVFAMATHYEGFCIPVLEAMSAGLPIVVSKIPPLVEIVGDTGQLVDNDPEAFAFALQRLIDDSSLRNKMGMMARQRAATLDGSVMEQREAQLYEALMKTTEESAIDVH
jgi:glycosyltransferase involved in cell wall biosynthesis